MPRPAHVPFRDNALFQAIPADRLAGVPLDLEMIAFAPGEVIFEEGTEGDCCYLVETGLVRISKAAPGGGQETLGFTGPGEFFGELALYYAAPRAARATAVSATSAAKLCRPDFDRLREVAPLEIAAAVGNAGIQHLRELHAHLVQSIADSDRFREIGLGLSLIAHDIRGPLATIKSAAELLEELASGGRVDPAKVQKYAAMIKRTATGALTSADELLAELRGGAQRARVDMTLGSLVQEVTEQVQGLLRGKTVDFVPLVEREGALFGERGELVRALVNLVRNSVEALPPEGGRVELRAGLEGGSAVFAIVDTGCGIPAEFLGRIFERRFTRGKAGGTGLGLHQVRSVVERHGGGITVDSREGEGTTFRVRLPAAGVAAGSAPNVAGAAAATA